jgi:hypothetical protein
MHILVIIGRIQIPFSTQKQARPEENKEKAKSY